MAKVEPQARSGGPAYRPDIDGLRAVAVLLVVLWHAHIPYVKSGYVGVDVFFVISGFVITGTLRRQAGDGAISIAGFYARRLRRIAPAFLAMLVVVLLASFVIQFPVELKRTASTAIAAIGLSANMMLWGLGGYWAAGADTDPLRHIWSLSVEEQFYLLYPLLLAWLLARAPKATGAVLGGLAALSAALFLGLWRISHEAAFELGPTRAWELLLGCLIALEGHRWRPGPRAGEALALLGAALLAIAVFRVGDASRSIGVAAVGGALIIFTGGRTAVVGRLLATPPLVFVGLISYSLYLWHWPVLALAGNLQPAGVGMIETAGLLVASTAVSVVSWRFVEQPLRRPWADARARLGFFIVCGALVVIALGAAAFALAGGGLPGRFPPPVAKLAGYESFSTTSAWARQYRPPCFHRHRWKSEQDTGRCFSAAPGERNVLLWGDSHAGHFAGALADLTVRLGAHFMQATMPACPPVPITDPSHLACRGFEAFVEARLKREPADVLVLSYAAPEKVAHLDRQLDALTAGGAEVILVGPSPQYKVFMARVLARAWPATPDVRPWLSPAPFIVDAALKTLAAGRPRVRYVSLTDLLCPARRCALFAASGAPLVWDKSHLTPDAAQAIVDEAIAGPLAEALRDARLRAAAKSAPHS